MAAGPGPVRSGAGVVDALAGGVRCGQSSQLADDIGRYADDDRNDTQQQECRQEAGGERSYRAHPRAARSGLRFPLQPLPLVVGDRLDTDILGGNNAGFATVAVLTGVDTRESILAARTLERPNYLIHDLTDLYRPYPDIELDAGQHRCGAASAVVQEGTVRVSGDPGDLDAWRAACSAWWAANPETVTALAPALEWLAH